MELEFVTIGDDAIAHFIILGFLGLWQGLSLINEGRCPTYGGQDTVILACSVLLLWKFTTSFKNSDSKQKFNSQKQLGLHI